MKKVPPLDAAVPGEWQDYEDPNPGTNPKGSQLPAAFFNATMYEMEQVITDSELTPDDADLTQLSQAIIRATVMDMPFMAGISSDGSGQDLAVQEYGRLIVTRPGRITGFRANAAIAPVGADLVMDITINGVSIFSTKPLIADGSNDVTDGIFSGGETEVPLADGDVIIFKVTQIGSTIAGQKLVASVKANQVPEV